MTPVEKQMRLASIWPQICVRKYLCFRQSKLTIQVTRQANKTALPTCFQVHLLPGRLASPLASCKPTLNDAAIAANEVLLILLNATKLFVASSSIQLINTSNRNISQPESPNNISPNRGTISDLRPFDAAKHFPIRPVIDSVKTNSHS